MLGQFEVWQLINLTGDTHAIHVHLDPFQIVSRRPIRCDRRQRTGLKDTIRVNRNEMVEIAVHFTTFSSRYAQQYW